MSAKILLCLDCDPQPSVFDAVVALDAGVNQLLRHGGIKPEDVRNLVYGTIFTRGPQDLMHTAIFIGGSDVAAGEKLLTEVRATFLGPLQVSVLLDSNGSNTAAAAAVLSAGRHTTWEGTNVAVLGATGNVGKRVTRLLAQEGANVRVGSRSRERSELVIKDIFTTKNGGNLSPYDISSSAGIELCLADAKVVIACGPPSAQLLPEAIRQNSSLKVAIDINAVPPVGIGGIAVQDKGTEHAGQICYGALGVGGLKMKIHKAAIHKLFERNDLVLDIDEVYALGKALA